MKQIAVVGAGFAGLAAAYALSKTFQVTLIDQKGIGGGASGVSSGLLHPYPGEKGRRSWHADEALSLARELIRRSSETLGESVAKENGILRLGPILNPGPDVVSLGPDQFLITSGITVFSTLYLKGLWLLCQKQGTQLKIEKVETTELLQNYDSVVLCVGAGLRFLNERHLLKVNFVKGQVLTCELEKPLERSISSKSYTAITPAPLECHIGGTYERELIDETPSLETAVRLLKPSYPVLKCQAGIRVTNPAHYFPILEQLSAKVWVITALGSRGLLYHALMAERLAKNIG